ncbi:hypothetical protein OKW43_001862 [Paraburkholderia sp. WC7.3g]|uniref:hypothetical protein n=1 Tax=Paraburkholderia sp. WC7.3g TaxID=2991070 RepID=UPI003D20976D
MKMCAAYKQTLFVLMVTWSAIAYAKDTAGSVQLLGNCDEQNECVVNLNASGSQWEKLCDSPDFSVLWTKRGERYLVQCRSRSTSEENVVWIIDVKTGFFGKLYFGRFFKKSILEAGPNMKIEDKFQSRGLCSAAEILRVKASNFVLLDKKSTNNSENPYCYDPIYLTLQGGRLTIGTNNGPFKIGDTDHAVHAVLNRDKARLSHLLDTVRRWHPEP